MGMALIAYGQEETADGLIEQAWQHCAGSGPGLLRC
jgi:hypothetical protein